MDDSLARREAGRPSRRVSAAAELGASSSLQDGEVNDAASAREAHPGADRLCPRSAAAAGRMERRNSAPQMVYQRYMPMAPLKLTIPRKTREKRAVFHISTESREYEDMMTILTSSYIDTSSAGWFTYSKPRLVHSEQLEKEFVEKRKEMKADGRTEKELEESYCFLLTDALKSLLLCEKGLFVGQSWITLLGNPTKGVYLSRYSDLLQNNAFTPGATGEIIIFKVMKGKVKSIYENMKNLLDPTPRFDSHISKNASKVTSVTSYRAFELTQQYFYEYSFDELRERPRQVCPYAIVSFQIKGKDSPLPSKPLAPIRLNSQSAEGSKERAQFTVWSGDLMKDDRVLFQISLRSFSPPFLPHRLPEKLEIGYLMRLDQVTKLLPSNLFSYNLYNSSQEVVNNGHCCSLLEVTDRNRFTTSVTRLLQELEIKRVVLVIQLTEKGFLFLLSSVQMATPTERGESWKRCLQALFVFPETRDMAKSTPQCATLPHDASEPSISGATVMPQLTQFIPALHHALVKARANPPAELSAGVERQAREYLVGLNDGTIRQYPMGEFDEQGQVFPPPKHHRVNMDSYLHSYLYSPALYLLSVARAKQMVEMHCGPDQPQEVKPRKNGGGQREATSNTRDGQANSQKMQQLIDLVLTCKSNAENEVKKEVGEGLKVLGKKRKLEQETAERALKFLKASQEPGRHHKNPVEGSQVPSSPVSLTSVIGSVGLKDVDLREDGSELANKLLGLLTGLTQAAGGTTTQSFCETTGEGLRESSPFDRLATKLGLPTNCDIDLRKQEELEEQTAGSVSSLEGFSPSSHSGETNHHGAGRGGGLWRRTGGYEEEEGQGEIPWVLIPITGLCSERYTQRDRNIPQDPRFQHFATATSITTTTKPRRKSPTLSPEPSPSASPFHLPSVEAGPALSPSQCPSPDPSPPISPSQCPSPESSPSPSPSQCPSPAPSLSPSPSQCPSPEPSPPPSPSHCWSPKTRPPLSSSWCQSLEPENVSPLIKKQRGANEERLTLIASREFTGVSNDKGERPQGKEKKTREPLISASIRPCNPPSLEQKTLPPPAMRGKEDTERKTGKVKETQVELSKKEKKARPVERVWKQGEADGVECKPNEEEVVDMMQEASSGKEQKGKSKELAGGSGFPPVSSAAVCPHRGIDSIVEKHVGDFSSEIQLLLQEESIHYSFPQSPHSTSSTEVTTPQHTLPYASISQFSQYVSFFNPCPPVHEYLSSLRDSINSMLTEFDDSWPRHKSDTSQTNSDATLANRVSAFVASVRAANAKTGRDDEVSAPCGELNAADASPSGSQSPALSRGGEVWRPDATNCRNPTTSHVTLSTPTSASAYKPASTTVLCPPNKSQQSQWNPHKSHTLETRTVTQDIQQTQDNSSARTVLCTAGVEGGRTLSSTDCNTTLSGYSSVSVQFAESSEPSEPVSSLSSVSIPGPGVVPTPPAAALSSLIGQLQPEVFSNLVKIIKDVKRNSVQFYLHCTEPGDQVYEDVRELLLKQGNVEQTPVAFLNQESSDDRLLVIIKNKDVAGHIHKIPGLVSLKRHSSVVFLGIDTLDDIRNNSYNELFVSGGCIISDDFVLNPDFITNDQLAALLMFLEKHSSVESVWRWKVHCKTHKRLKEQARFRRDAANLLDMLSAYQKRQIVEFLPYHHCDMMIQQSPNLDCLIELQARYTQYRHTIFLTEHHLEKFFAYSSGGIIVSSIEEILHNFTRMVGCHDIKDKQPFIDDLLAPKEFYYQCVDCTQCSPLSSGHSRQVSHGDSASGSEHSPSIFPEQIHSLPSGHQPQRVLSQPGASIPSLPHLSDQLVPDSSCRDRVMPPSDKDCEVLRRAISQLRAERQAQLKQLQQQQHLLELQAELSINPIKSCTGTPAGAHSNHTTPPDEGHPDEPVQLTPGRAVAATLDLIHSTLQPELGEERQEAPTQGPQREAGDGDQRGGNHSDGNSDMSTLSSNHKATAVMGASNRTELANNRRDKEADPRGKPAFSKAAQHGASTCSATASSVDGDGSSGTQSGREQPVRADKAPPSSSTAGRTKVTGNITAVTDHDGNPSPALPQLQPIQRHPNKQQLNPSHPPHSQHRGSGLLQSPLLPRLHSQPFSPGPMLGPLTALGGIRSLLGPTPVWSGSLGPTGAAALVWGFQQTGRDFSSPGLLGGYHGPAGQDGRRYRGGQRGGGFNGM